MGKEPVQLQVLSFFGLMPIINVFILKNTQILEDIRSSNIHTLRSFFLNAAATLEGLRVRRDASVAQKGSSKGDDKLKYLRANLLKTHY